MLTGKIKTLIHNRGYGFILSENEGKDLFFHCSGCEGDFEDLKEGMIVTFELEEGEKGKRAVKVQRIAGEKTEEETEEEETEEDNDE